jgi:maltooligosyltrehalose trehalohydrolase
MGQCQPTTEPLDLRRYPIGVEVIHSTDGPRRLHARVWAPDRSTVEIVRENDADSRAQNPSCVSLHAEGNGYYSGFADHIGDSGLYRFRLDGEDLFPDPASRYQPEGPHGPSMVIDPATYDWGDSAWRGVQIDGQVIYELHLGTFTAAGSFQSAIDRLPELVDLGVSLIEVMPLADFSGRFGWGYDGVNMFAPCRLYGIPDDFRAFVDAAHRLELGVILDVVYNHFGPDGNYLRAFASAYLAGRRTEWGDAPNFDGPQAEGVREYVVTNARYWIEEFHLDGLRLDATQQIFDSSPRHIIEDIRDAVVVSSAGRDAIVIGENEPQDSRLVRSRDDGGYALDALWNDDFHHVAWVAATGRDEAYFSGYRGSAQELVSAAKYGFLYQGQWFRWQHNRRGTPSLDLPPTKFIAFTQNHDQVANTAGGRRIHQETSPGRHRALTALLILLPQTPMLFQGQEFSASAPFLYFADHSAALAAAVRDGRTTFVSQFPSFAARVREERVEDPTDPWTFVRCKLDWAERTTNAAALALHRDLIRLRRDDPVIRRQWARGLDGAVFGEHAFVLRYFGGEAGDRVLIVNLGARLHAEPMAEPLLAPPLHRVWRATFSTDAPEYGGWGAPPLEVHDDGWWIPGESATLLSPSDDPTTSR